MIAEAGTIATNLVTVRERVARATERAGRHNEEITVIAVSKTFPSEVIRAAYAAGLRHFGENRVQEWEQKHPVVAGLDATWHLIGHLQSNKARRAAKLFHRIDSVDNLELAKRLDTFAAEEAKRLRVLIEVHLGGEETKSGVAETGLPSLLEGVAALPHLDLLGLMTIPPFFDQPENARPYFRKLRTLRDDASRNLGRQLPALSMGMSHDFEIAIEEGATEIRVGTALFGARQAKA
jgi:PLP dependent protein